MEVRALLVVVVRETAWKSEPSKQQIRIINDRYVDVRLLT